MTSLSHKKECRQAEREPTATRRPRYVRRRRFTNPRCVRAERANRDISAKRAGTFKKKGGDECPIIEWSAKTHQERSVPVPNDTLDLVRQFKQQSDGSPYIFLSLDRLVRIDQRLTPNGRPTAPKIVNNLLRDFKVIQRRAARNACVKDWRQGSIHDLRRTYGTRTAEFVPMHVLQKWMGHKDISTTVRYYLGVPDRYAEIVRQAS